MRSRIVSEHVSVLVAGAVFLFGLMVALPALGTTLLPGGLNLGGLGLFVILAYATGHIVAALGMVIENFVTLVFGSPSDQVTLDPPGLVASQRIGGLEERIRGRLGAKLDRLTGLDRAQWRGMVEQIYADVSTHYPGQLDANFNIYAFNRDLCAASIALAVAILVIDLHHWPATLGMGFVALIYAHRMRRFDTRLCREMLLRFLTLPVRPVNAGTGRTS